MTHRELAAKLRDIAAELERMEPPPQAEPPPPSEREVAAGLLAEFGAWQARGRQRGVVEPMSPELQEYVERNPPELRAFQGGHPRPMDLFRPSPAPEAPAVASPAPPLPPTADRAAAAPASGWDRFLRRARRA